MTSYGTQRMVLAYFKMVDEFSIPGRTVQFLIPFPVRVISYEFTCPCWSTSAYPAL